MQLIRKQTDCEIAVTFVWVLHQVLWEGIMANNVPSRAKCKQTLPLAFADFPNCRIIIDCTEVEIAVPANLQNHCSTYSNYKGRATFKALVGCSPNGVLVYASDLYGGSTHDKAITKDCGILEYLETGDSLLVDKGFTISYLVSDGVVVNMPSFLYNGQFTASQVQANKKIAGVRIHIERAIQRVKIYRILDQIPWQYRKLANKLFQVCVALTNLQTPIISEVSSMQHVIAAP